MKDSNKHCNDVSSGAKIEFECDECGRRFTTKQGRTRHKTMTHKKNNGIVKRNRSVGEKSNSNHFECEDCNYNSKSKWALKTHKKHKHKEPTSPHEKKPKISSEIVEVVEDILSEVLHSITRGEETENTVKSYFDKIASTENKNKTKIEPTKDFLTKTAVTLAEMLDNIADQLEEEDEVEDDDTEEIENRLDILRGDEPRHKKTIDEKSENTLVTLPLREVEEMRRKLRNLEDINGDLANELKGVEKLRSDVRNLEDINQELIHKLKESEEKNKNKEPKKNKGQAREEFIVIEMDTNEEEYDVEELVRNKETGYSRINPQSGPQKKKEISTFDCQVCEKKFNKREHMISHHKTHKVSCQMCDQVFKTSKDLKEHIKIVHDEMICHVKCEGGKCTGGETGGPQTESLHKCNFCEEVFPSKNTLSTHRADVHRTFKPCRDTINCQYQTGCYFSHVPVTMGKVRCYQCGDEFDTKNTMMIHRKIHGEVKECMRLINNQCERRENCWWSHEINNQVFQKAMENPKPPIQEAQMMQPQMQMKEQNRPNEILVNMVKKMTIELMQIKELLNIH